MNRKVTDAPEALVRAVPVDRRSQLRPNSALRELTAAPTASIFERTQHSSQAGTALVHLDIQRSRLVLIRSQKIISVEKNLPENRIIFMKFLNKFHIDQSKFLHVPFGHLFANNHGQDPYRILLRRDYFLENIL